jgi:hypothetical protein
MAKRKRTKGQTTIYKTITSLTNLIKVRSPHLLLFSRVANKYINRKKSVNNWKTVKTVMTLTWDRHFLLLMFNVYHKLLLIVTQFKQEKGQKGKQRSTKQ